MIYKIFADTNIVIDHLTKRQPFNKESTKLFILNEQEQLKIHVSALCINTVYYITRKLIGHKNALDFIDKLTEDVEVLGTTKSEIRAALESDFTDFEDGIQYATAISFGGIDFMVTRNVSDFKESKIAVHTPTSFLKKFKFEI
ncbi:MAG TPA: PIN domain-containing protein [Leeuwenhoekiella sp.]|nr:PIN domain-containing protein [Leeuwenhoekiella sp.]